MKKIIPLLSFAILMLSISAYSQKYKTTADSGKLNLEYVEVSNDIADYKVQLATAQAKLVEYQEKARAAETEAQESASSSSDQASKATNGSVDDAKKANKKAKKAYDLAKDRKSAENDVKDQNEKIEKISSKIKKKEDRLQELNEMRTSILTKLSGN